MYINILRIAHSGIFEIISKYKLEMYSVGVVFSCLMTVRRVSSCLFYLTIIPTP